MLKPIPFFISMLLAIVCTTALRAQDDKFQTYQKVLKVDNDTIKCRELIKYAIRVTDTLRDYDFALLIYENVNSILKKRNYPYPYLNLKLYYYWGYAYYQKGGYREAEALFTKALDIKLLDDQPAFKAKILNNAGANLYNMRVFKRAMTYYNNALEIYTHMRDFKGMGSVYWNMSNISTAAGNFKEANRLLEKAEKLFLNHNLIEDYGILQGTKAYIQASAGNYDSAIIYTNRGFKIPFKNQLKKPDPYIQMYISQGKNYAEIKKWDSCFYCLNRAKALSDSLHLSSHFTGNYYFFMGYCNDLKHDFKKSIYYYKQALKVKTGIGNYRFIYENMADIYLNNKQYDSAFYYKELAIMFADSLYKSELQEHTTFENKRIELLENDYRDRVRATEQERSLQQLEKKNYTLVIVILVLFVGVLLFFVYFRQYRLKIKKEHLQSELDFLKAQLNPHFLFNSINNIYVLMDENKDRASEILLKFSELMRYQLYECNVSSIYLNKELQFLENYMEFEKLRYSNKIRVNYTKDIMGAADIMIAPLVLQPFIENAFKHAPKKKNLQSTIDISVTVKDAVLLFEVSNTRNTEKVSELPGGIGLENVRKRLKLLYPGKYDLGITETDELFKISLKLTLSHD